MKLGFSYLGVALLVGLTAGCTSTSHLIPGAKMGLEDLSTRATYEVMGYAEGEAKGAYLFGFIPVGESEDTEYMGGYSDADLRANTPVRRAALYKAIASVPGADAMIAPRWEIKQKDYIVYSYEEVKVRGKVIRIKSQ